MTRERQVIGWRWIYGGLGPSDQHPTRESARKELVERFSLHASYADKFVFPDFRELWGLANEPETVRER